MRVAVLGAGPGGYQAAVHAARRGAAVVLIEPAGLGGVCLNWGCIPTKTLLASARALDSARRLHEFGVAGGQDAAPDWPAMQARKAGVIELQAQGIARLLQSHGVEVVAGRGRLLAAGRVAVALNQGGQRELDVDRVILATGARPADLPGLARDGRRVLNSDDLLGLASLPASICIVGGGVVGCEFATLLSALGCQVTLVEALDRLLPLPSLEPEISKLLLREFKKRRVAVHTGCVVESLAEAGAGLEINLAPSPLVPAQLAGKPLKMRAEMVLVAAGRRPNSEDLGLEAAGVECDAKGAVRVDARLATSAPGVYAIGDLLGPARPMLAHVASAEAEAAAINALGGDRALAYDLVPSAAFTWPEAAWVGLSLAQARERGIAAALAGLPVRQLGKAQAEGEIAGQYLLVHDTTDGRLLGAHLLGPHAGEMIHECALGLSLGARLADIARTVHAHPTLSEGLKEAAEAGLATLTQAQTRN
ncbi:MAG: dihydrolipoyl dehydrogenase [Desulfarculus sp.]|nr:dihydrolipoyl dehydrogenase [Desulfarculus sp.]